MTATNDDKTTRGVEKPATWAPDNKRSLLVHLAIRFSHSYKHSIWFSQLSVPIQTPHGNTLVSWPVTGPLTSEYVNYHNPTPSDLMELAPGSPHTTSGTWYKTATAPYDPKQMMPQANIDVGDKSSSFETELLEPAATAGIETALSFTVRILDMHTLTKANKGMNGIFFEDDAGATWSKPQPLSKSVVKTLSDPRSEIAHALADLGVTKRRVWRASSNITWPKGPPHYSHGWSRLLSTY